MPNEHERVEGFERRGGGSVSLDGERAEEQTKGGLQGLTKSQASEVHRLRLARVHRIQRLLRWHLGRGVGPAIADCTAVQNVVWEARVVPLSLLYYSSNLVREERASDGWERANEFRFRAQSGMARIHALKLEPGVAPHD